MRDMTAIDKTQDTNANLISQLLLS